MPTYPYFIPTHIVVNDPDPLGALIPGLLLNTDNMTTMVRDGHFTPGTLLRRKSNGELYRVRGAVGCKQELEAVCEAAKG